ncbi:MAG TPA: iron-containing alcohol dehydrogenase [Acidobacteriota bacterium]|nr:iron-containing alcohol dehydrogenase [Acidobacteriota bacterium]
MINFQLSLPTRIVFGPGRLDALGDIAAEFGSRALIVSYAQPGPLKATISKARELLRAAGIEVVCYEAIEPNPHHDTCDSGAELLRESGCDMIVAIGGGSAIDASKAISAAAANDKSCWEFCRRPGGLAPIEAAVPIIAIPTTAATGSEANGEAVISNPHTHEKCVLASSLVAPRVAVCDPKLHLSIPREATADGCVDIISHCLESYLSGENDCALQDRLTEGVMNTVFEWGPVAVEDGGNLRARRELQYASLWGISDLIHSGRGGSWLMHNIEHAISGHYDIPHGRGMAIVIPRVLREVFLENAPERLAQLGKRCFGLQGGEVRESASEAVRAFVGWLGGVGRDLSLGDVGIGDEQFEAMAEDIIRNDGDGRCYHSVVKLDRAALVRILEACLRRN